MTPEDYRELIYRNLAPTRLGTETVALADALGRTLATDVAARLSVPPFDNSAMDGFAVRGEDFSGSGPWDFRVAHDIPAGMAAGAVGGAPATPSRVTNGGACAVDDGMAASDSGAGGAGGGESGGGDELPVAARIMTGAPVPEWADAVVPVEDTDAPRGASAPPSRVQIFSAPKPAANVRYAGEDLHAGDPVMKGGTVMNAHALSSLASVGYGEVEVVRRPQVAVVATGSELVAPGEVPSPGMIPDSNTLLLSGLVREAGGQPVVVPGIGDTAAEFARALPTDVDLIVTSGGVSMGAFDPVKEYGLNHGWTFAKVAMQPGKPQGHGLAGGVPLIALPGNPVSVAVSFRLFVRPFMARLLGQPEDLADATPHCLQARAGTAWRTAKARRQYLPGVLWPSSDGDVVVPVHSLGSGSHLVASMHKADVLAVVAADVTEVREGDLVTVIDL